MPFADPDQTDPMILNGVAVEIDDDEAVNAIEEMAVCFIEEFLRMGFDPQRVLAMFPKPGYAGPHLAWRRLGRERIEVLIEQQARLRGHRVSEPAARAERRPGGDLSLPVLDPEESVMYARSPQGW